MGSFWVAANVHFRKVYLDRRDYPSYFRVVLRNQLALATARCIPRDCIADHYLDRDQSNDQTRTPVPVDSRVDSRPAQLPE